MNQQFELDPWPGDKSAQTGTSCGLKGSGSELQFHPIFTDKHAILTKYELNEKFAENDIENVVMS